MEGILVVAGVIFIIAGLASLLFDFLQAILLFGFGFVMLGIASIISKMGQGNNRGNDRGNPNQR